MRSILFLILAACGGGGGGSSGDDDSPGPDAAKPTRSGFVSIQSYDAMNTPNMPTRGGSAGAAFFATGSQCTTQLTMGACEVEQCDTVAPGAVSAGTITITGAQAPISLVPATDKTYTQLISMTTLFAGGESIAFSAAGADVPAFTTSLTMPTKATITAPTKPASASPYLAIDRSHDFTVSWSGGGSGLVQVALNASGGTSLFCRFPASGGTGAVPSALLAMLPAGMTGGFAMASISRTESDAGDYAIDVSSYFNAVWPDDAIVSGPTTLQ